MRRVPCGTLELSMLISSEQVSCIDLVCNISENFFVESVCEYHIALFLEFLKVVYIPLAMSAVHGHFEQACRSL